MPRGRTDFYAGKTISIYIGTGEGPGALSAYPRAIAQVIGKYIPGNPAIVVRNMPGAGGIKAANFIYGIAPQDGTAWGFITRGFVRAPMLGDPAGAVRPDQISLDRDHLAGNQRGRRMDVRHPVRSLADAMTQEVVFGGTSLATDTGLFPTILNRLIGTRFKVIIGYKSSTDVDLAMERGEVQGKIWTWGSLKSGNTAGWVEEQEGLPAGAVRFAEGQGLARSAAGLDYAKTPEDRQVMELIFAPLDARLSLVHGPGRSARAGGDDAPGVRRTMQDPEFIDLMKQQNLVLDPGPRGSRAGDRATALSDAPIGDRAGAHVYSAVLSRAHA